MATTEDDKYRAAFRVTPLEGSAPITPTQPPQIQETSTVTEELPQQDKYRAAFSRSITIGKPTTEQKGHFPDPTDPKYSITSFIDYQQEKNEELLVGAGFATKRAFAGAQQLYHSLLGDEESYEAITTQLLDEEKFYRDTPVGQAFLAKVGEFAASTAPFLLMPQWRLANMMKATPGAGAMQQLGAGAVNIALKTIPVSAMGAAYGAAEFAPTKASRTENILFGLGAATGLSLVGDTFRYARQGLANHILQKSLVTKQYKEGDKILEEMEASLGVKLDFNLAQMSSLPSAERATIEAAKGFAAVDIVWQQQVSNIKGIQKAWSNIIARQQPLTISDDAFALRVHTAYNKYIDKLVDKRKNSWVSTMRKVDVAFKNEAVIPVRTLDTEVSTLIRDLSSRLSPKEAKTASKELLELQEILGENILITGKELQDALSQWGKLAFPKTYPNSLSGQQKVGVAKKIYNSLIKDLDAAAINPDLIKTAPALKTARDLYRRYSEVIDSTKLHTVNKFLGKDIRELNIEDVADKLAKLKPSQTKFLKKALNDVDPMLVGQLKTFSLRDAWKKAAQEYTEDGMPIIDIKKFWKNAPKKENLKELFNPEELKDIDLTLKAARRISKSIVGQSRSYVELMQNLGGVAASLDSTFIAITAAKIFGHKFFTMLGTREGRKIIQKADRSPVNFVMFLTAGLASYDDSVVTVDPIKQARQNIPEALDD